MIIRGHGILWDPKRNKAAARFVGGELDTSDPRVIELAQVAGFVETEAVDETISVDDKAVLLAIAEERGIEVDKRWGVARLRDAIEAAQ